MQGKHTSELKLSSTAPTIAICGAGIGAWMAAAYLKCEQPELDVLVIGPLPEEEKRPLVGESLIEISTLFFKKIGLGRYLENELMPKFGQTFYYQMANGNGRSVYSAHGGSKMPGEISYQLNRSTFDIRLREHALSLGVKFLHGKVQKVNVGQGYKQHALTITQPDASLMHITCKYMIDCSGRSRVIGKAVSEYTKPALQRSCYWIRLADFEPFLANIDVEMRSPHDYDLWKTTHHFMGEGYWVWGIPYHSDTHTNAISLGITYRSDLFAKPIANLQDALALLDQSHPELATMVRSGTVLDENSYYNYMYAAKQMYSQDRWFLIGDTARTFDPMYSYGLTMLAIQVEQTSEMIKSDEAGRLEAEAIDTFDRLCSTISSNLENEIANQYPSLADSYQAHLFRYWGVIKYFNMLLPAWYYGYLRDPKAAEFFLNLLQNPSLKLADNVAMQLFAKASKKVDLLCQSEMDSTMNLDDIMDFTVGTGAKAFAKNMSKAMTLQAVLLVRMLKKTGWHNWHEVMPVIAKKYLLAKTLPLVFSVVANKATKGCKPVQI